MKIVIVGAGTIGSAVVEQLEKEGHDIVLMDKNAEKIERINDKSDIMTFLGNGFDLQNLKEAGIEKTDVLIAVTEKDTINVMCAMCAKKFGVKHTVARVRSFEFLEPIRFLKKELGVSMFINPEHDFTREVVRMLQFPTAKSIELFANGKVELIEMLVEEDSKLVGLSLLDISKKCDSKVLACVVERNDEVIIPRGDFVVSKGDKIHLTGSGSAIAEFAKKFNIAWQKTKKVIITGGGLDSCYLAQELCERNMDVKIIEKDKARAETLAELLPKATIVFGDYADTDILVEEGVKQADAFIALSGHDEINVMLSLFASKMNAKKIIARIDNSAVKGLVENVGTGAVVMPKRLAADTIVSYVRAIGNADAGKVITLYKLLDGKVEALEFKVEEGLGVGGKTVAELKLKKNLLIAAIIKNGNVIIPNGSTKIDDGDGIIVVTTHTMFDSLDDILED